MIPFFFFFFTFLFPSIVSCFLISQGSNRPEVFCKKGVLTNFAKFTGKHLCQRLFFNKVAGLRPQACNFIKKESLAQMFSCEFCEISKNTFSYRTPPVAASISHKNSIFIEIYNSFIEPFQTNFVISYYEINKALKKYIGYNFKIKI